MNDLKIIRFTHKQFATLLFLFLFSLSASAEQAEHFTYKGINYIIISKESNEVAVNGLIDTALMDIGIPSEIIYKGTTYRVTAINDSAFISRARISSIEIPNSVTRIGQHAFAYSGLTSVKIPNSVTEISKGAFYGTKLKTLVIPNSVRSVGAEVCSGVMNSVIIGNSVNYIDRYAFAYAFITKGIYPMGIINPFNPVENGGYPLQRVPPIIVTYPADDGIFEDDGFVYNRDKTCLHSAPLDFHGEYIVPTTVTTISAGAFLDCKNLTSITIPSSVLNIGKYTFSNCSNLVSVEFPNLRGKIGECAFENCSALSRLSIPKNVHTIDSIAFAGCSSLKELEFLGDDKLQVFPDWYTAAYEAYPLLENEMKFKVVPGGTLSFDYEVSDNKYHNCLIVRIDGTEVLCVNENAKGTYTKKFDKYGEVTLYMSYAKKNMNYTDEAIVSEIKFTSSILLNLNLRSKKDKSLFADCPLEKLYIGRRLSYSTDKYQGYSPFYKNTTLRKVEMNSAENTIKPYEFYGCTNLQEFVGGNGVKTIGEMAFCGCKSLKDFICGDCVEEIGTYAFNNSGLTTFTIGPNVYKICNRAIDGPLTTINSYAYYPPNCDAYAFEYVNNRTCVLRVPAESMTYYKSISPWRDFFNIQDINSDISYLPTVEINDNEIKVNASGVSFQGDKPVKMKVYTIDGKLYLTTIVQPNETITLPSGSYIIRHSNKSVKIRL